MVAGKPTETFIAYLGKRELAKMRAQSEDKEQLRQLVKDWIHAKEKGKLLARVSQPKQKQDRREKSGDL
jgi:hypothetical protein